jgi:hypothetical protein
MKFRPKINSVIITLGHSTVHRKNDLDSFSRLASNGLNLTSTITILPLNMKIKIIRF